MNRDMTETWIAECRLGYIYSVASSSWRLSFHKTVGEREGSLCVYEKERLIFELERKKSTNRHGLGMP